MAVKFEFSLSDRSFDKLRLLRRADGETNMTFDDYAELLLSSLIDRMYREYNRQGLIKEDEND
ncbi:hypothetical protein [uncultured Ruminococcus sp.]|uniref:hypothetical protein n=1 Tax=uncultured Ruminococcus sp. TaxID=165186 RepID=UPI00259895CE|nr:hypothetical protein [uncultured Ruminococcus sp.]